MPMPIVRIVRPAASLAISRPALAFSAGSTAATLRGSARAATTRLHVLVDHDSDDLAPIRNVAGSSLSVCVVVALRRAIGLSGQPVVKERIV